MKSQKISILLAFVVLTAILALTSLLYWSNRYEPTVGVGIDLEDFVSEAEDTIYRNESYRFGLQSPEEWIVEENGRSVQVTPPDIVSGRAFFIEVTDLSAAEYKATREAEGEYAVVFDELEDIAGYKDAERFNVSTAFGTDDTILFIVQSNHNFVLNYHAFNKTHQQILQSFQFLD